jgi:hypothetical protein
MDLSPEQRRLRQRFFNALLETTFPLKTGPDPEVTLELLIQAAEMLLAHLENELAELRQEQAE